MSTTVYQTHFEPKISLSSSKQLVGPTTLGPMAGFNFKIRIRTQILSSLFIPASLQQIFVIIVKKLPSSYK